MLKENVKFTLHSTILPNPVLDSGDIQKALSVCCITYDCVNYIFMLASVGWRQDRGGTPPNYLPLLSSSQVEKGMGISL